MSDEVRCKLCGEGISEYEPVTVVSGNWVRVTSLAVEPELSRAADVRLYHDQCSRLIFEGGWGDS